MRCVMKILIADDEKEIRTVLRLLLEHSGNEVIEVADGKAAVDAVMANRDVDICIMDIMMPALSGIEAAEAIRGFSSVPILFLTARSLEKDKIAAYGAGGDDYIVKPFSARELMMKVEALTRRYTVYAGKGEDAPDALRVAGGVVICPETREVFKNGKPIDVRDKEMEVLLYLVKNRGRAVDTDEIYSSVWGEIPLQSSANTVTVHILNLRRKLEDPSSQQKIIRTVWGKGYQID